MQPIHLVIIDALNLIRRVHAAQADEHDIKRTITTTQKTLNTILQHSQPSHIVAIFDHSHAHRGWRSQTFPDYKAGRRPMPPALRNGLDHLQQAWWQMGIDSLLSEQDEADDLIATLATKVAAHQQKVTIISTDKGYCQLLSPHIQIRDYFQQRWLDSGFIAKEFAVKVAQLTDFWGLAGVASSNIHGVPGIGPRGAQEILAQYDSLEQAYRAGDLANKYQTKLQQHIEAARMSKMLATLQTDIPLGFNLQDLRYRQEQSVRG